MKFFVIFSAIVLTFACSNPSFADELTVSGNGEGSNSQISISSSNTNTQEQNNTAQVDNNSSVSANTGNNTASSNSGGDTSIQTGNATIDSSIQNSLNASTVGSICCPNDINGTIAGNGSNSTNTIDISSTTTTTTLVSQNATIINNVQGVANTGNNSANDNGGRTTIHTGTIWVSDTIKNGPINVSQIENQTGISADIQLSIFGNGSNSINSVRSEFESRTNVYNIFNANIINNSRWDLTTGNNVANGNIGGADIKTGDILFASVIENGPINVSKVDVECCKKEKEKEEGKEKPKETKNEPSIPTSVGGSSPSSGGTSSGGVGGIGSLLPTTGSLWTLFMTLASVVLFFFGWYLRFRSGNAPPRYSFVYSN